MLKSSGYITFHGNLQKNVQSQSVEGNIYELWVEVPDIAKKAMPGQFVSIFLNDKSRLLPRPISICSVSSDKTGLRLVYRVTGKGSGTGFLSTMPRGANIDLLGPAGNGFPLDSTDTVLIGGGIGIPPLLELMKRLKGRRRAVLGYKGGSPFLKDEFEVYGRVYTASDDGSIGVKGTVMDAVLKNEIDLNHATVMACGPLPMLRALKEYCTLYDIKCYVSLEERMACSIGACLACVCNTVEKDSHSCVNNARVCKDGPVFPAEEVVL